jgi:hypothetical protein
MRILIFLSILFLTACKKELATNPLNEQPAPNATLLAGGSFQNGPYGRVSGLGQLWRSPAGAYEIVLDSFSTSNGPDLFVYLSKEIMPIQFIEAGKLRSTSGRQVYTLPSPPDLSQYRYVVIHCKAFNHLFGYALLQ